MASKMIDDLEVFCGHEGCKWEGLHAMLKKHEKSCEHRPKKEIEDVESNCVQILDEDDEDEDVVQISESQALKKM